MPYAVLARFEPIPGKGEELIQKSEELTRQAQAAGQRIGLTVTAFGDSTTLQAAVLFDSLAAVEAYPTSATAQALRAREAELRPLMAGRPQQQLFEVIAQPAAGGPAPAYQQTFTLYPQGAKQQEFMQLLMARMQVEAARGTRGAVAVPVSGNIGTVSVLVFFGSLAELEKDRSFRNADAAWQAFATQMAALSAGPPLSEIRRVIVPLPPQ